MCVCVVGWVGVGVDVGVYSTQTPLVRRTPTPTIGIVPAHSACIRPLSRVVPPHLHGFRVSSFEFREKVSRSGIRAWAVGVRVQGLGLRVQR